MQELTLAVVGIDFPNADGSNRRSEAMMTLPGAPIGLVPEPKNRHDPNAIAVFSPQGVQIGYLNAERAPYVGARIAGARMCRRSSKASMAGPRSSAFGSMVARRRCRRRRTGRQRRYAGASRKTRTRSSRMKTGLSGVPSAWLVSRVSCGLASPCVISCVGLNANAHQCVISISR
jgi:hypothetical protein